MSHAEDDEFAELFGSAPVQSTESEVGHTIPATISAVVKTETREDKDEDLDYESDENDDNIISQEEYAKMKIREEIASLENLPSVAGEKAGNESASSAVAAEEESSKTQTSKVIKDEQVEKLLSDVSEKYQPLFAGSSEPKVNKQVLEQDLDDLESHPWRNPNANPEDYFNYGFDEETWRMYCKRQKDIRGQASMSKPINVFTGFVSSERTKKIEDRDMDLMRQMAKGVRHHDEDTEEAGLANIPEEVVNLRTDSGDHRRRNQQTDSHERDNRFQRDTRDMRDSRDSRGDQGRDYRDKRDMGHGSRDPRDDRGGRGRGQGDQHYRYDGGQQDYGRDTRDGRDRSGRDYSGRDGRDTQYRREDSRKREREYDNDREYSKRQRR